MYANMIEEMEFNRFGWIAIILLIVGCLGGMTVGLGAIASTLAMIIIVIPTMLTLSLLLAVAPMRWIVNSSLVCVGIDLFFLGYYLLF
ncbi:MAG: hypothetical protein RLZZ301_47 [Bacteroidota bacterium]|jgi:hypothetical protein